MDQRDLNLAQAAHRAAEHTPEGKGAGVSAWDGFVEAFLAELAKDGFEIVRVGKAARAPSAGH